MNDREYFVKLIELAQNGNMFVQSGNIADTLIRNGVIFPKIGQWRFCGSDRWNDAYECSVCGKMAMDNSNYCPNCGAKMLNK